MFVVVITAFECSNTDCNDLSSLFSPGVCLVMTLEIGTVSFLFAKYQITLYYHEHVRFTVKTVYMLGFYTKVCV